MAFTLIYMFCGVMTLVNPDYFTAYLSLLSIVYYLVFMGMPVNGSKGSTEN
jgi:hypothetical protein